jgi:hypothetical protein
MHLKWLHNPVQACCPLCNEAGPKQALLSTDHVLAGDAPMTLSGGVWKAGPLGAVGDTVISPAFQGRAGTAHENSKLRQERQRLSVAPGGAPKNLPSPTRP